MCTPRRGPRRAPGAVLLLLPPRQRAIALAPPSDPRESSAAPGQFTPMPELDPAMFGPGQPCFGCSPDHPIGFRLRFAREGDEVVTRFVPGDQHQGPPGIMHGGLVTTLADELAAWTIIGLLDRFGFTASVQVKLHRPVRIGIEVEGRGRIVSGSARVVNVGVRLLQGGAETLTGEIAFAVLDRARAERLLGRPLPEGWGRFARDRDQGTPR